MQTLASKGMGEAIIAVVVVDNQQMLQTIQAPLTTRPPRPTRTRTRHCYKMFWIWLSGLWVMKLLTTITLLYFSVAANAGKTSGSGLCWLLWYWYWLFGSYIGHPRRAGKQPRAMSGTGSYSWWRLAFLGYLKCIISILEKSMSRYEQTANNNNPTLLFCCC